MSASTRVGPRSSRPSPSGSGPAPAGWDAGARVPRYIPPAASSPSTSSPVT